MHGVSTTLPAAPIVGPVVLVAVLALLVGLHRRRALTAPRVATVVGVGLYAAAVSCLTVFPLQIATGDHGNRTSWLDKLHLVPVVTIDARTFVLNVLLLAPLGLVLPLLRRRHSWANATLVGLAVSSTIEVIQGVTDIAFSSGRAADVNDLIANTLGAVLGYATARALLRTPRGRAVAERFALPTVRAVPPQRDHLAPQAARLREG